MKNNRIILSIVAIAIFIISGCAATPLVVTGAYAGDAEQQVEVMEFEISEDMNQFIFNKDVVFEDGMPAHGSSFITEGYIYEAGTLDGTNGVNADGSAEFPDKVIGKWICSGFMYGDAAHADGGPWVVSTQLLIFDEEHGGGTIVNEGLELSDIGVWAERVVTGGTGRFFNKTIEAEQALQGFNVATEGVVLSYKVSVQ